MGSVSGFLQFDAATGKPIAGSPATDGPCGDEARPLGISPDRARLARTASDPEAVPAVTIVDAKTGKTVVRFEPWPKRELPFDSGFRLVPRFLPDGDRIALLLANDTPREASLAIWSLSQNKRVADLDLTEEHREPKSFHAATPGDALAVSPDGRFVAAGNLDFAVHLYDVAAGGAERRLDTDLDTVNALAFSPDGTWLAATGQGGSMTIFEIPSGRQLAREAAPPECGALAISPDGKRIAIGCDSSEAKHGFPVYPTPHGARVFTRR